MNAAQLIVLFLTGVVVGGLATAWVLSLAVVLRAQRKDDRP